MKTRNTVYYATRETDTTFECHVNADKSRVLNYDCFSFGYGKDTDPTGNKFATLVQEKARDFSMVRVKPEAEKIKLGVKDALKSFLANPGSSASNVLMGQLIRYQRATQLNSKPISNTEAARILASIDWIKAYRDAGVEL